MDTNTRLQELYNSKYQQLSDNIMRYNSSVSNLNNRASNPLMLKINEDWQNADVKVMIFGQENNFWGGECDNGGAVFCGKVNEVIDIYETFYLNKKRKYGPYWNEFNRIINKTTTREKKVAFLWNNIVKIGRLGMGCVPAIHKITNEDFNVIAAEIRILKPNILIFLTGPDYDIKIKDALGDYTKNEIKGYDQQQMCEIKFDTDYDLALCVRTHHPNYLYFQGKPFKDGVINEIISNINSIN